MERIMDDVKLMELMELLGDLSLEAETLEMAIMALKLQNLIKTEYGENFL
jgi:hypothetical protein